MLNQTDVWSNKGLHQRLTMTPIRVLLQNIINSLIKQEHSRAPPQATAKVQIWSQDRDDFQNLTGTFLSRDTQRYVSGNISFSGDMSQAA